MRMSDNDIRSASLMLAARAGADPRTVAKVLRGDKVLRSVRASVESAARELGIALPEGPRAA